MIRRKKARNNENKYSYAHPKSLFKQYFEAIPPGADALPSIVKENAKRRVEASQKMHQLAKENSPADAPKKSDVNNDKQASPVSTTEKVSRTSSFSSSSSSSSLENHSQEIELKLFLHEMARGRKKCELIFGHKKGTDSSQAKRLGVEDAETMPGCYKRNLGDTITRGPGGWSEFVITYDNKFILNYTDNEIATATAAEKHKFDFTQQTMGYGTFLKAAGKIQVTSEGKIIISPFSEYLELGWDYLPIILFVLREKGVLAIQEDILIADEQGAIICVPEINLINKVRSPEKILPFYLNESRFPLAKAIAENKELDVAGVLSKLFLNIDDSILSAGNKKDVSELLTKRNHLKTATLNLLLALTRNDLSNDLFKVAEKTIDQKLSEISKNNELIKSKFNLSIKEAVEEAIYHNLCEINNKIELMQSKDEATLKKIFAKVTPEKFLKLKTEIDHQPKEDNPDVNLKKVAEKSIAEKLSEIKRNIESINKAQAKKGCQVSHLKEFIDSVIYQNLCAINESILSIKNKDEVTLKELMGKAARQHFYEVDENIQLIDERHGIDLSFVKNELDIWLHYIFNLKFQTENKLGAEALSKVESRLKEIKAGSLPQRHIDACDLTSSPFIQFYSENPTKTCIALLRDYTKGGFFWRLLTGAWRRHHIKAVDRFLKEYDNHHYTDNFSIQAIYQELFDLKENTLAEYTGKKSTLFARLLFCEKLENRSALDSAVPVVSVVNVAPNQHEALSHLGCFPSATSAPISIKQPQKPTDAMASIVLTPASSSVSSPAFYMQAPRDRLSPLPMPAPVVKEELTPPAATSSLKPGH